jgi:diguanylate cyclase
MGAIRAMFGRLAALITPPVPPVIAPALERAQFASIRRQVPMLLSVAAINTIIIMAVCFHDGLPLANYGWMALLILYCVVRMTFWVLRLRNPVVDKDIPRLLRMNVGVSLVLTSVLGVASAATFIFGTFGSQLLVPMSLGFGATSIAHCFYTLRPAAIGTIIFGLFPSSLAMLFFGNFDAQMLGVSMISVGLLMMRFVAAQYDQLIQSLLLEDENRRLANSDPLTGIANRRAIMNMLNILAQSGASFGVALLDLDGFKEVNDGLGHHAGDLMLQNVSERLAASALPLDSVGRLGGDEFVIVLRNLADERDLSARTTAMLAALCQPLDIDGHVVPVAASLGYAQWDAQRHTVDLLLRTADSALYSAKRASSAQAEPARQLRQARIG